MDQELLADLIDANNAKSSHVDNSDEEKHALLNVDDIVSHKDEFGFIEDKDTLLPLNTFKICDQYFANRAKIKKTSLFNVGNLEQYLVKYNSSNTQNERLWFSCDPNEDDDDDDDETVPQRKLFSSIDIQNLSNIDSDGETFRARFDIKFSWIPTKQEYKILYCMIKSINDGLAMRTANVKSRSRKNSGNEKIRKKRKSINILKRQATIETLVNKKIKQMYDEIIVLPDIMFPSSFEIHKMNWQVFDNGLKYKIERTLQFGGKGEPGIPFRAKNTPFITSTIHCDVTFVQEFELQQYPFDIQDLTLFIGLSNKDMSILPQLNKGPFSRLAQECSEVGDYRIVNYIVEFGSDSFTPSGQNSASEKYNGVIIRLKAKRRWLAIILNSAFVMFCLSLLSLLAFTIDILKADERMGYVLTLILTAVASQLKSNVSSYLTFLDIYMFTSYSFLSLMMIESAFCRYLSEDSDSAFAGIYSGIWVIYHTGFVIYTFITIRNENKKIYHKTEKARILYGKRDSLSCFWLNLDQDEEGDRFMYVNSTIKVDGQSVDSQAVLLDYLDGYLDLRDLWNEFNVNGDSVLYEQEFDKMVYDALIILCLLRDPDMPPDRQDIQPFVEKIKKDLFGNKSAIGFTKFKSFGVYLQQQYAQLMSELDQIYARELHASISGLEINQITPASVQASVVSPGMNNRGRASDGNGEAGGTLEEQSHSIPEADGDVHVTYARPGTSGGDGRAAPDAYSFGGYAPPE